MEVIMQYLFLDESGNLHKNSPDRYFVIGGVYTNNYADIKKSYVEINHELKEKLIAANEMEYLNYSPLVWHAPVGAIVAQKSYGIIDQDVLNAIKYHTTGRPAMSTLEKIIFLADYIEPGRIQPGVDEIRNLSGQDLNRAVAKTLANTIAYLKQKSSADIHPDTMAAYEYYYDYL